MFLHVKLLDYRPVSILNLDLIVQLGTKKSNNN